MSASNTLLTIDMITRESLRVLTNNCKFVSRVNRQFDSSFAQTGAKVNATLRVRKPSEFTIRSGATASVQDYTEQYTTITMDQQLGLDLQFTSVDLTLSLDDFSDRIVKPAMVRLSNEIDFVALKTVANKVAKVAGTVGTTPATAAAVLEAGRKLDDAAVPRDMRYLGINPAANASLVDALKGIFNPQGKIGENYRKGIIANDQLGFDEWFMTQNIPVHTNGVFGGTPLMNGSTVTTATTLVTDGWTAAATKRVLAGDRFTVAGVYSVNPVTKQANTDLYVFQAAADASSDGSGNLTITLTEAIYSSGARQNISALPADNAALTFYGAASAAYPVNLAYHQDAFTFASADLELPIGVPAEAKSRASDPNNGLSVRLVGYYDGANDISNWRFDALFGVAAIRPQLAVALVG